MAEINLSITASSEDGEEIDGTDWYDRTETYTIPAYFRIGEKSGTNWVGATRFTGITVPQGTTLTSATLTITVQASMNALKEITVNVFGDDVDNAPVWGASSRPSSGFTPTTASGSETVGSGTRDAGDAIAIDVIDVVQEIVDRTGWSSGNAMRFSLERDSGSPTYNRLYIADYSETGYATLDIVYPDAGGVSIPGIMHHFTKNIGSN